MLYRINENFSVLHVGLFAFSLNFSVLIIGKGTSY